MLQLLWIEYNTWETQEFTWNYETLQPYTMQLWSEKLRDGRAVVARAPDQLIEEDHTAPHSSPIHWTSPTSLLCPNLLHTVVSARLCLLVREVLCHTFHAIHILSHILLCQKCTQELYKRMPNETAKKYVTSSPLNSFEIMWHSLVHPLRNWAWQGNHALTLYSSCEHSRDGSVWAIALNGIITAPDSSPIHWTSPISLLCPNSLHNDDCVRLCTFGCFG